MFQHLTDLIECEPDYCISKDLSQELCHDYNREERKKFEDMLTFLGVYEKELKKF